MDRWTGGRMGQQGGVAGRRLSYFAWEDLVEGFVWVDTMTLRSEVEVGSWGDNMAPKQGLVLAWMHVNSCLCLGGTLHN
jgi:hypothetical protein